MNLQKRLNNDYQFAPSANTKTVSHQVAKHVLAREKCSIISNMIYNKREAFQNTVDQETKTCSA